MEVSEGLRRHFTEGHMGTEPLEHRTRIGAIFREKRRKNCKKNCIHVVQYGVGATHVFSSVNCAFVFVVFSFPFPARAASRLISREHESLFLYLLAQLREVVGETQQDELLALQGDEVR